MSTTVEKARADVTRLAEAERALVDKGSAKAAELIGLEQAAGEDQLTALESGATVDPMIAGKVASAREEVSAIKQAIYQARQARLAAIAEAHQAEAAEKRQQAAKLRAEASARQKKTEKILAELKEHEGADYVVGPRPEYLGAMLDRPLIYGVDAGTTRTAALVAQAETLEKEAAELEARPVSRSGTVTGSSVEALYTAVLSDPFTVGPTLDEIQAWAAPVEAKVREAWRIERLSEHRPTDDDEWNGLPRRFYLCWRGLAIVPEHSGLELFEREPEHEHPTETGGLSVQDFGRVQAAVRDLPPMVPLS